MVLIEDRNGRAIIRDQATAVGGGDLAGGELEAATIKSEPRPIDAPRSAQATASGSVSASRCPPATR
jgi:hypothetical protein